jgi:hypothetical protein
MNTITSLLLLSLLFFTIQAGYQYEFWLFSDSCSGNPTYSYKSEGDCGISDKSDSSSNTKYVKVTYELGTGDYTVYEYNDKDCKDENRNFKIKNNELDKCIKNLISSYKFKLFFVCFAGQSKVLLDNNEKVQLSDLEVGQSIASYGGGFSEVYTFLDYQNDIYLDFLEIHYLEENGKTGKIALSHEHLILASRKGDAQYVLAKEVKMGDYIYKSNNGSVIPVIVSKISVGKYKGAIAPATMDGTVIVDDIVVSSYAGISHNVAHTIFAPLRLAYKISPSLVSTDLSGMHPYAKVLYDTFSNWVQHPHPTFAPFSLESN